MNEQQQSCLLAIDQGTTSTRAILFDRQGRPLRSHAVPLRQIYPANGWVEHDPAEIWQATLACCRDGAEGRGGGEVAAIGITNQRETSLIWDRKTRQAAAQCHRLAGPARGGALRGAEEAGVGTAHRRQDRAAAGSLFLGHQAGMAAEECEGRPRDKNIAFGTIDSWLIWNLTAGRCMPPMSPMPRAPCCGI